MARTSNHLAWALGVLGCFAAALASSQGQVYRYVDGEGRIVYSDHAPPPSATNIQVKKLGQNLIETEAPVGARMAQERFPVTFYTFDCGELCQRGETLLNRRGVPYTTVNVSQQAGADRLKHLTGEMQAPVLQVGDKLIAKGFNEAVWQGLLTEAGYPQTPMPRRAPAARPPPEAPKAVVKPAPAPPEAGGGYPK
jgi:glutaredoxin